MERKVRNTLKIRQKIERTEDKKEKMMSINIYCHNLFSNIN